jgi:hypothetical protein
MECMVTHGRIEPPRRPGLVARILFWATRRRIGQVPKSMELKAHDGRLLFADTMMTAELAATRFGPEKLKALGVLRAATLVGCPL